MLYQLSYASIKMVPPHRIELRIDDYKSTVIPFNYRGMNLNILGLSSLPHDHWVAERCFVPRIIAVSHMVDLLNDMFNVLGASARTRTLNSSLEDSDDFQFHHRSISSLGNP